MLNSFNYGTNAKEFGVRSNVTYDLDPHYLLKEISNQNEKDANNPKIACLVVNSITGYNYGFLFNLTTVGQPQTQ